MPNSIFHGSVAVRNICKLPSIECIRYESRNLDKFNWRKFFNAHMAPWVSLFFKELESAQSAALYMPVGTIGRLFMAIEAEAFELAA